MYPKKFNSKDFIMNNLQQVKRNDLLKYGDDIRELRQAMEFNRNANARENPGRSLARYYSLKKKMSRLQEAIGGLKMMKKSLSQGKTKQGKTSAFSERETG